MDYKNSLTISYEILLGNAIQKILMSGPFLIKPGAPESWTVRDQGAPIRRSNVFLGKAAKTSLMR